MPRNRLFPCRLLVALLLPVMIVIATTTASAANEVATTRTTRHETAHKPDMLYFSQLPIVHEGRIKPLGRVARLFLYQIAAIDLPEPQASQWLATVLFDPHGADRPALFHVPNTHLRHVLSLPADTEYFSFETLHRQFVAHAPLILGLRDLPEQDVQPDQKELLALYAQVTFYEQLRHALTLVLPFRSMAQSPDRMPQRERIITLAPDRSAKLLAPVMAQGELNQSFRVIPLGDSWVSPWAAWLHHIRLAGPEQEAPLLLQHWAALTDAYIAYDPARNPDSADDWIQASRALLKDSITQAIKQQAASPLLPYQLKVELLYHTISPYRISLCLYVLATLLAFLTLLPVRSAPFVSLAPRMVMPLFLGGLGFHLTGILCRMFILQRPPVSTLYESILFVGAVIMSAGLWYSYRKRESGFLPVLGLAGIALHLLGFVLNEDGDSLHVLQAVLDTRFWLATHVIVITCGYALCLFASLIAHLALWTTLHGTPLAVAAHRYYKRAFYFSLLALLFVTTGTLLGGIWADQSWGRFWGWDPKENGALLIILWLVWLLHGRVEQRFSARFFLGGLCALSLVVGLSWIGVNLLGIGLHSYGFISGSATSLTVLCIIELVFFAACAVRYKKSRHTIPKAEDHA